jgi:hypothetical protein
LLDLAKLVTQQKVGNNDGELKGFSYNMEALRLLQGGLIQVDRERGRERERESEREREREREGGRERGGERGRERERERERERRERTRERESEVQHRRAICTHYKLCTHYTHHLTMLSRADPEPGVRLLMCQDARRHRQHAHLLERRRQHPRIASVNGGAGGEAGAGRSHDGGEARI